MHPVASNFRRPTLAVGTVLRGSLRAVCLLTASWSVAAQAGIAPSTSAVIAPVAALQDLAELEGLARAAGTAELSPASAGERLMIGPIQPGLRLTRCSEPVKSVISPAPHMKDRVLVELRCQGFSPWHLFVPVRMVGTSPVVVAAHALVIGSVLKAEDLRIEQRDVSQLPPGYLAETGIALGLTAARPIAGGAVLTNQQLMGAKAVQRGQSVTLLADAGGISVRMAGRALCDGLVNQRIKVQNLSSGKVVEGITRSEQVVEINAQ